MYQTSSPNTRLGTGATHSNNNCKRSDSMWSARSKAMLHTTAQELGHVVFTLYIMGFNSSDLRPGKDLSAKPYALVK